MNAAPGERVQVDRKGGDQGFAFAGLHLGDLALVQNHAADELHIEVAHLQHTPAGFARYGESFRQQLIEHFLQGLLFLVWVFDGVHALANLGAKFLGLCPELFIAKLLDFGLERIDALHQRQQALDLALVAGAENLGNKSVNQCCCSLGTRPGICRRSSNA